VDNLPRQTAEDEMTDASALGTTTDSMSEPADSVLIAQSRDAPEQFGLLFRRYATQIHAYAARRLGEPVADDVMAETFLAAFRHRARYDLTRQSARPWLYGIATRLIARHRRAEARAYSALARTGVDPVTESFADEVITRVMALGARTQLAGALARLKTGDRDVLLLIAWADLTYEEVSESLGIPVGTVRSRLHRARAQVRQALATDSAHQDTAPKDTAHQEDKHHG
jgi:RNA polymerase sigma-70 factor (ECF subfamily)